MKHYSILVCKETRAGESRVALIPSDVKRLVQREQKVFVEHGAGTSAGYPDSEYQAAGAEIRYLEDDSEDSLRKLFSGINLIVRAKRPARAREAIEASAFEAGTIMMGALDPLERGSPHIDEYRQAHLTAYSIDQLVLPSDDPMNLLAAMSEIAGRLALLDGIKKWGAKVNEVVIIGFGVAGKSAFAEALSQKIPTTVILSDPKQAAEIKRRGGAPQLLDRSADLQDQQAFVRNHILDADIVIACARRANHPAPLLISKETLLVMKKGSVIVDLALSEGGNVEGSEHDATHILGNGIKVTNISGYPKKFPREASQLWSRASFLFIGLLIDEKPIPLEPLNNSAS